MIFVSYRLFNKKRVYAVSVKLLLLMPWARTWPNFRGSMDKQTQTLVPTAYFSILRPWGYMIHKTGLTCAKSGVFVLFVLCFVEGCMWERSKSRVECCFCLNLSSDLTHWGRVKMAAKFLTTFSNAFSWMKIYRFWLKFHCSSFPRLPRFQLHQPRLWFITGGYLVKR